MPRDADVEVELSRSSVRRLQMLQRQLTQVDILVRRDIRGQVAKDLRKKVVPILRDSARRGAATHLPSGLARWVAKSRGSIKTRYTGKNVGMRFYMSRRNKKGNLADLMRINRGRARHPFWGRYSRRANAKGLQNVIPGWFDSIEPDAVEAAQDVIINIIDDAIEKLR